MQKFIDTVVLYAKAWSSDDWGEPVLNGAATFGWTSWLTELRCLIGIPVVILKYIHLSIITRNILPEEPVAVIQ
jgi:hypothetical protein